MSNHSTLNRWRTTSLYQPPCGILSRTSRATNRTRPARFADVSAGAIIRGVGALPQGYGLPRSSTPAAAPEAESPADCFPSSCPPWRRDPHVPRSQPVGTNTRRVAECPNAAMAAGLSRQAANILRTRHRPQEPVSGSPAAWGERWPRRGEVAPPRDEGRDPDFRRATADHPPGQAGRPTDS